MIEASGAAGGGQRAPKAPPRPPWMWFNWVYLVDQRVPLYDRWMPGEVLLFYPIRQVATLSMFLHVLRFFIPKKNLESFLLIFFILAFINWWFVHPVGYGDPPGCIDQPTVGVHHPRRGT